MKLKLVQFAVEARLFEQSRMGADIHDAAMSHHDDAIRIENRREAMRNGDDGAPVSQALERRLDHAFRFGIERRCRLIQ